MNLHRAGEVPEWDTTPRENWNIFQKLAARTGKTVTPANILDVACLGLFFSGLRDISKGKTFKGVLKLGAARLGDMVDGTVAEATKTKSPLGEAIDAVIDKIETAAAVPVLASRGLIPKRAAAIIVAQNIANTAVTLQARTRGVEIHSSQAGKHATFGQSFTMGMYSLSAVAGMAGAPRAAEGLAFIGDSSLVTTSMLGSEALYGYAQDAMAPLAEQNPSVIQTLV